jgi:hypothetical protein
MARFEGHSGRAADAESSCDEEVSLSLPLPPSLPPSPSPFLSPAAVSESCNGHATAVVQRSCNGGRATVMQRRCLPRAGHAGQPRPAWPQGGSSLRAGGATVANVRPRHACRRRRCRRSYRTRRLGCVPPYRRPASPGGPGFEFPPPPSLPRCPPPTPLLSLRSGWVGRWGVFKPEAAASADLNHRVLFTTAD